MMASCTEDTGSASLPSYSKAVASTFSAIAIIGNSIGIYLLKTIEGKKTNQMIIIMSLSCVDTVLATCWLANEIILSEGCTCCKINNVSWSLRAGLYLVWYAMMFFITVDRLLGCNFPIKHKLLVTKKTIYVCLVVSWTASILFFVFGCIFNAISARYYFDRYVWPAIDFCFAAIFIFTYSSIFIYLRRRKVGRPNKASQIGNQDGDNQKFVFIVGGLTIAFFLFEVIPTAVSAFYTTRTRAIYVARSILYTLNLVCDPVLYILLHPRIRKHALEVSHGLFAKLKTTFVSSQEQVELAVVRI